MKVIETLITENPYIASMIISFIGVLVQRYMPGIVPFLGDVKRTSVELSKLAHYHTEIDTKIIKERALKEGLKLAAKALDSEIVQEQKKKIKDQLNF
jgi:hypothetical protein